MYYGHKKYSKYSPAGEGGGEVHKKVWISRVEVLKTGRIVAELVDKRRLLASFGWFCFNSTSMFLTFAPFA